MGRLPGRHCPPTRCASRCACSCRAAPPASRGPTFYTQWDREVGALLTARALYMQGIRPGDVVLNSWAYGTHNGAFVVRRGAAPLAELRGAHHRAPATSRAANARCELAIEYERDRDPHHRRLPAAPRRRRARDGLRPDDRLQAHARCPTSATASCSSRRSASSASTRTASTRCSGCRSSARRTTGCTSSRTRSSCRSSTPRPASRCPTASWARSASPSSTRPAARSSGTTSWTSRTCTRASSARAGAGCGKMAPFAGRGDNMVKLRGVNVWPEAVGDIALDGRRRRRPTTSCARCATDNRDELIVSVVSDRDAARARGASRDASRRGSRTGSACASPPRSSRRARSTRWTEVGHVAQAEAVPR